MDRSQPKSQTIEGQRRLRDACDLVVAASYYAPETRAAYEALGLAADYPSVPGSLHYGAEGYMCGRAAPLGDADAAAVASCFGILSIDVVDRALAAGWRKTTPARAMGARAGAADALFTRVLGAPDARAELLAAELRALVADADASARPVFAALRAADWPAAPWAQLWRAADLLREYRGACHLAAAVPHVSVTELVALTAAWFGRDPRQPFAHLGHSDEVVTAAIASLSDRGLVEEGNLTVAGRRLRVEIEAATDAAMRSVFAHPLPTELPYLESLAERFFDSGDLPATRRRPPGK